MAVPLGLGEVQRVQDAGRQPVGRVERGVERARERVGGREPIPSSSQIAYGSRCRRSIEPAPKCRAMRPADAASTPWVSRNSRSSRSSRWSRHEATARAEAARADAGDRAQHALGVAVDRVEHLVGAVALDEPDRRERPDVLDRLEVGADRVLADGLLHPHVRT